ncbi:unnamed protein product [Gordionus sp. m RMFG-2023]|uniref:transmembrane protein 115-like n=1 Tax=Gordionus sp. m RMFG-2023 TaxID=3053472 RepID=UPI0030E3A804
MRTTSFFTVLRQRLTTLSSISFSLHSSFDSFLNCGPVTRTLILLLLLGHACTYYRPLYESLSLTPVLSARVYAFITHSLIEPRFFLLFLDALALWVSGKLVEPVWGSARLLIFYFAVSVLTSMITGALNLLAYGLVYKDVSLLFNIRITGLAAFLAGLSVAVKQIMPAHVLIPLKINSSSSGNFIRNAHLPLLLLCITLLLKLAGVFRYRTGLDEKDGGAILVRYETCPYPCMFGVGLLISWIYLRFWQKHGNGTRGDSEEAFSFASFFPTFIQPPIVIFSNLIYGLFVKLRLCKKINVIRKINDASSASIVINLPGIDTHDAERRRLKALKALNERMTKTNPSDPNAKWPSLDHENHQAIEMQSIINHIVQPSSGENVESTPTNIITYTSTNDS